MSHISKIELEVKDLYALKSACARLGLDFISGKKTFKWFGTEASACDHGIIVPGADYEIGVLAANSHFELQCDYYDPNIGKIIGKNGGLLKQAYGVEKTKAEARKKGYSIIEQKTETGIRLHVRLN
jgi:hypothetical protein